MPLNHTHNPAATSWVTTAQQAELGFPIQNLPYCMFKTSQDNSDFEAGIGIGDQIVPLNSLLKQDLLSGLAQEAVECLENSLSLNPLMALTPDHWQALRSALFDLLSSDAAADIQTKLSACLVAQADAEYSLPAQIGDYTDFYSSVYHATNVGKLFRPDNPLLPNYKWIPIGYHGRASSIFPSGTDIRRPLGQLKPPTAEVPTRAACKRLDYELEMGFYVGQSTEHGQVITIDQANEYLFGMCIVNDWSARDMQGWEYQPLGPFLAKSFATTISPWIVTMAALEPYQCAFTRDAADPQPLPYLTSDTNSTQGNYNLTLELYIQTEKMRAAGDAPHKLSSTNFNRATYWTIAQMLTHHSSNGCNLQAGDLIATGTLSGPEASEFGSLLELSNGGKQILSLPNGEERSFLLDGDSILIQVMAQADGLPTLNFGKCEATILPALPL